MDAFVHCFEAYCAPGFHPLADGVALEGMRLIKDYLPRACENGGDIEARSRMLAAASMGATAFQKGLGAVHALAHPVGAFFDTHHGLTNAVITALRDRAQPRRHRRAHAGRSRACSICRSAGVDGVLDWVLAFRKELGIPHTLAEIGVHAARTRTTSAARRRIDPSAGGNPHARSTRATSSACSARRSRATCRCKG